MHPHDELPSPVSPAVERRSLLSIAILSATLALIAFLGFLAFQLATASPSDPLASSTTTSSVPASPFSLVFPDMLVLVTNTPEATVEPTPTYAMLPTPRPPGVCMTATPKNEVCTQPKPPLPTATPIPTCPVIPGDVCVHPGGTVRWLPTPTLTAGAVSTNG